MAGSYLIFSTNQNAREDAVNNVINKMTGLQNNLKKWKDHPDFLIEKPFSLKNKFLVIPKAYLLTTQAQNALLKTLEEPPPYANIFLLTKTRNDLLQTVGSRCRIIPSKKGGKIENEYVFKGGENSVTKVLTMKMGKKLDWAHEFSKEDQEIIIETLENWVLDLREDLLKGDSGYIIYSNIQEVIKIKEDLTNTNVNKSLALKKLVLHLQ